MDKFIGFDVDHKHTLACVNRGTAFGARPGKPAGRSPICEAVLVKPP